MSRSGPVEAVWCCSTCGAVYHKDYPRCPNDGGEVVVKTTDPLLGQTIGRYAIERFVGEGGMGRVYEARHTTLANKRYAVKVLLGDAGATPSMRKRFAREAESASRLVHPNVVGVIDYGATEGGLPYIVMDFVDGESLAELIDSGPMPPARVVRLMRAVCDGLAFAHEAGVVHRDLKPANIIVTADDVPRIADFGLAQTVDGRDARLTSTGMAMGTPAYAAPEQMAGKVVDHRADLYALGMTMFELLSGGVLPFQGGPMDVATAKAHREAPAFSEVCRDIAVPESLEALIASLLRRRASDRPQSTAEVIAALEAITLDMAVDERAGTVHDSRRRTAARARRAGWMMPAVLAGLATTGIVGWIAMHRGVQPSAQPAEVAQVVADPVVVTSPSVEVVQPVAKPEPVVAKAAAPPHHRKHRAEAARLVSSEPPHVPDEHVSTVTSNVVARLAPPPELPPAPPPPKPIVLHAAITTVDVHGSLPAADVRRAVDRALPAIEHCIPKVAQNVVAQLTIGEGRRAEGVHASGGTAAACVSAALGGVRTESAPDVGEVEVVVHVKFAE
jgi:serine/threonine-protein kinase